MQNVKLQSQTLSEYRGQTSGTRPIAFNIMKDELYFTVAELHVLEGFVNKTLRSTSRAVDDAIQEQSTNERNHVLLRSTCTPPVSRGEKLERNRTYPSGYSTRERDTEGKRGDNFVADEQTSTLHFPSDSTVQVVQVVELYTNLLRQGT